MSVEPLHQAWSYNGNDAGIVLFTEALRTWQFDLPEGARVLELGCCESDWAQQLLKARPDVQITGIDVRPCPGYPGLFFQCDASELDSQVGFFDAIVGVGSIEHFGLGWHEYGDRVNPQADWAAYELSLDALKQGGLFYFDVPWTPGQYHETAHYRCYDDLALAARFPQMRAVERARGWAPDGNERGFTQVRPLDPHSPFYFTARWLTKVA